VAVGEVRDSDILPTRSAILGLLGAVLGLRRDNGEELGHLGRDLKLAFRVDLQGSLLQDYHTAQVPSRQALKHHAHRTRKDELDFPKEELSTILSTRQYRVDAAYTILVSAPGAPGRLRALTEAMDHPAFVPYLGRKSCALAWPMSPRLIEASDLMEAFREYDRLEREMLGKAGQEFQEMAARALGSESNVRQLAWEKDLPLAESIKPLMLVDRRDEPLDRRRWQFAERQEARDQWHLEQP
jgi:CRISPR system Cascade subunit CasD